jgi:hypothetical protein
MPAFPGTHPAQNTNLLTPGHAKTAEHAHVFMGTSIFFSTHHHSRLVLARKKQEQKNQGMRAFSGSKLQA